jgi:hypothetical protein
MIVIEKKILVISMKIIMFVIENQIQTHIP